MRADVVRSLAMFAALFPLAMSAQDPRGRWQLESRMDVLISRTTAVHAGVGGSAVAGRYIRLGILAAGGARKVGGEWRRSGRADVVGRFHVDPNRQFARGLYVLGGATVLLDDGAHGRVRALIGLGIESRAYGSWIVGAEGGFGGGGRIGLTVRRARAAGR